ncbi:MAG: DNA-binding protein Alba [archaeon]
MTENQSVIYIGKKGLMKYILAATQAFNAGANEITIKARGKLISRAVDVAEIIKNKFMKEIKVKDIKIGTEEVQNSDGSKSLVSNIEIVLSK